ncbi:MAG: beta-propeller domain-containing protein [Nitrososphaerales archaeon]
MKYIKCGKMVKKLSLVLMIMMIVALSIVEIFKIPSYPSTNPLNDIGLKTFTSYNELKDFIITKMDGAKKDEFKFQPFINEDIPNKLTIDNLKALNSKVSEELRYSKTNIQVTGVDEGDIIKTDGNYIYTISNDKVFIVKAYPPEQMQIISKIRVEGKPIALFINKDRILTIQYGRIYSINLSHQHNLNIKIYDLSNIKNPNLIKEFSLSGNYLGSRMIGDYIYILTTQSIIKPLIKDVEAIIPWIAVNGIIKRIPPSNIYYSNEIEAPLSYTMIVAINIFKDSEELDCKVILTGYATSIYVSMNNIYVTIQRWKSQVTEIHRIGINGSKVVIEANGKVPGRVLNQFSMDEYNNYFRVATTTERFVKEFGIISLNHIYILDKNLRIIGKLEGLAPEERIYSARFIQDRCYLVTFRNIDPLFTIDLSDPNEPKVLGELKIPGYSEYLHPYSKGYLIGVGREVNEGLNRGLKISLFNVSDVTKPSEIDKIIIGDRWSDSLALKDHHAFLFDEKRGLLVIPVLEVFKEKKDLQSIYNKYVFQGVYIIHISLKDGIRVMGKVTHVDDINFIRSGYINSNYEIKRSLYINNILYTISNEKIKANDLSDLKEIANIKLS